jgi:hypothetical protein
MAKSRNFGSNIILLHGHESSIIPLYMLEIVITEIVLDFLFAEGIIVLKCTALILQDGSKYE